MLPELTTVEESPELRRVNAGLALADRLEKEADYSGQRYIAVDIMAARIRRALAPADTPDNGYLRRGERRTEQPHRDLAQGQP